MSLVIQDVNSVPAERWQYPVRQTGFTVEAPSWSVLYSFVETHCQANNIAPPSLQEVTDWVCKHLHVKCYDDQTRQPLSNAFTQNLPIPPTSCCSRSKK